MDGLPILAILKDAEPSYFSYLELHRQDDQAGQSANLQKIGESIDNMLL